MTTKTNLILLAILLIVPSLAFKKGEMPDEGNLILMDTSTGASCLDGSPTGYYLKKG